MALKIKDYKSVRVILKKGSEIGLYKKLTEACTQYVIYRHAARGKIKNFVGNYEYIDNNNGSHLKPIDLEYGNKILDRVEKGMKYSNIYIKYLFSFLITLAIALLLAAQPDIGQTLLIFFSWSILIFVSGININFLIFSILFLSTLLYFSVRFLQKFEYIKNRIDSFFNPKTGTHKTQQETELTYNAGGWCD